METRDYSVSMGKANLLAIVLMAPLVATLAAVFVARWSWAVLDRGLSDFIDIRVAPPLIILGIVSHEIIHAVTWAVASRRPLSAIAIGFQWRSLSPYAHPRAPIGARAYRIGAAMPGLVLGLVPAVAAIALGRPLLLVFGLLFTIAAGGDALVLWLIRGVPPATLVRDHPTRAGCVVLE
ncbi:MAG TPA: DUF3267 domain-containing protein [Gemmatimonadales bacterium]|jgi:hypothetical protein